MRILEDISIFKKQKASIVAHSNNTVISDFGKGKNSYAKHIPRIEVPNNTSIYTSYFSIRNSDEQFFQRRINPNFLSIEYVVSGEHYICCGNHGVVAEAGDIVLLHPYMEHDLLCPEEVHCVKYGLCIYGEKLVPIIKTLGLDSCYSFHVNDTNRLIKCFDKLHSLFFENTNIDFDPNIGLTFELLNIISQLKPNDPIQEDIDIVIQFFKKNLDQKINLDQVASLIGKSLSSLTKMFLANTHITPYQYLRNMRMQYAYELLLTQKYSVKEVCAMTGYSAPTYFAIEFKKFFGHPPTQIKDKEKPYCSYT